MVRAVRCYLRNVDGEDNAIIGPVKEWNDDGDPTEIRAVVVPAEWLSDLITSAQNSDKYIYVADAECDHVMRLTK